MAPEITRIESVEFGYEIPDVGTDQHGFNLVYDPGSVTERKLFAIRVETDAGITGAMKRARAAEGFGTDNQTGSVHVYE